MKNKKLVLPIVAGLLMVAGTGGFTLTTKAYAAESDLTEKVKDFFDKEPPTEEEIVAHKAEMDAKLKTALDNGSLSQNDYDLAIAIRDIMEENRPAIGVKPEIPEGVTKKEFKTERQSEIIEKLAEKGFTVTAEDLEAHRETMQSLGLGGPRHVKNMRVEK